MAYRLELITGAQTLRSPDGQAIPLRSYKSILAALAFAEKPLPREQLVVQVWPDATVAVGRNRLRVALVKLRALIPNGIAESEAGLSLDPTVLSTDVDDVRLALERAQDSVTASGELEALTSALSLAGPGHDFDVNLPGANLFGEHAARAWVRAADLATVQSHPETAIESARAATFFNPASPDTWTAYLIAHWQNGSAASAINEVTQRAPKPMLDELKVREAMKKVRTKEPGAPDRLAKDRRGLWLDVMEAIAESRPDLMRAILSSPQTLAVSGKQPRIMHDMLRAATPLDLEAKDSIWERSAARMIGLKAWLGDAHGVLEAAPAVLEWSQDDQILRAVWNAVAVAHSLTRDWHLAFDALEKTMEYSKRLGNEVYELATIGNAAFFRMQQGRFEESERGYEEVLDRLSKVDRPQARFEYAIAIGNRSLIPVLAGDWSVARSRLEEAMEIRSQAGATVQMGILHASLALAKTHLGRPEGLINSMRLAFLDAFESDSFRSQQFTFEIAAAILGRLGDAGYAQGLLRWVDAWREESRAPRSPAEAEFVARIPNDRPAASIEGTPAVVGRETMKRLRSIAARSL